MKRFERGFLIDKPYSALYGYEVKMDNISEGGAIASTHSISSKYSINPLKQSIHPSILSVEHKVLNMTYTSCAKKELEWNFIKNKTFLSTLFNMSHRESMDYYQKKGEELFKGQWDTVNSLFAEFPKLPTTGLVHAFVFDVIGMEQILSHIISCDVPCFDFDTRISLGSLKDGQFDMSAGLFDEGSNYKNGDLKVGYLGDAIFNERPVVVFIFSCGDASFCMRNKDKEKSGFSYYQGNIAIDNETGVLYGAEMTEYIFSGRNRLMRREMMIKMEKIDYL